VGPRASLDMCKNITPTGIRSPDRPDPGWAPGPVWTCAKNLTPTGIQSPDHPTHSQSLYCLSYPGPFHFCYLLLIIIWQPGLPHTILQNPPWTLSVSCHPASRPLNSKLHILLQPPSISHKLSNISLLYQGSSSTLVYVRVKSPFTNILLSVSSILLYCFSLPFYFHTIVIFSFM
jgi:hypothetical protein